MQWCQRVGRLLVEVGLILIGTSLFLLLPGPVSGEVLYFKNTAVAFISLILIGKTLYDTFFESPSSSKAALN